MFWLFDYSEEFKRHFKHIKRVLLLYNMIAYCLEIGCINVHLTDNWWNLLQLNHFLIRHETRTVEDLN